MRRWLVLAVVLSPVAAIGCQPSCGDVSLMGNGSVGIELHLTPESDVTPPETVMVSSPVQLSGTLPTAPANPNTSFTVMNASPSIPLYPFGAVLLEPGGQRELFLGWTFEDGDPTSPPSNNQFDVTVTDAAGKVTGRLSQTGQYTWHPAMVCQKSGYWNGPQLSDDGGVD